MQMTPRFDYHWDAHAPVTIRPFHCLQNHRISVKPSSDLATIHRGWVPKYWVSGALFLTQENMGMRWRGNQSDTSARCTRAILVYGKSWFIFYSQQKGSDVPQLSLIENSLLNWSFDIYLKWLLERFGLKHGYPSMRTVTFVGNYIWHHPERILSSIVAIPDPCAFAIDGTMTPFMKRHQCWTMSFWPFLRIPHCHAWAN